MTPAFVEAWLLALSSRVKGDPRNTAKHAADAMTAAGCLPGVIGWSRVEWLLDRRASPEDAWGVAIDVAAEHKAGRELPQTYDPPHPYSAAAPIFGGYGMPCQGEGHNTVSIRPQRLGSGVATMVCVRCWHLLGSGL